eukprot:CAMPEP_0181235458 /NCGR_PEP_ID=MMETSP1096-20121128/37585_1 /TAXON_ID=156174 ORGANISM="Chrysochromulina ericina, Strain CCMP281" /NCGR_SAMPLE_ID=MMETSP1096 /ASSEMBLY_ACC=CAM_ASM_000453 /LENGTH=151 /DNA_ID=CAMNT_0023330437 /DNA_START=30 /DNA_END=481 /DNA_ORIENTATION=+
MWLDGDLAIHAADVMLPYLLALALLMLLLIGCLGLVALYERYAGRAHQESSDRSDEEDPHSMSELLSSLPKPTELVRESSTLFRRASESTRDKYQLLRGGLLSDGGDSAAGRAGFVRLEEEGMEEGRSQPVGQLEHGIELQDGIQVPMSRG